MYTRNTLHIAENIAACQDFDGRWDYIPYEESSGPGCHHYSNVMSGTWAMKKAVSRCSPSPNTPIHLWDHALKLATVQNLTHLELIDMRISHVVLIQILYAYWLESLIIHAHFEQLPSESVVLWSNHVDETVYTFLPHLEELRLVMVGHDDELVLFQSVVQLLRLRPSLHWPGFP